MFDSEFMQFSEHRLGELGCLMIASHQLAMRALQKGDNESYNILSSYYSSYRTEDGRLRVQRSLELDRLTLICKRQQQER